MRSRFLLAVESWADRRTPNNFAILTTHTGTDPFWCSNVGKDLILSVGKDPYVSHSGYFFFFFFVMVLITDILSSRTSSRAESTENRETDVMDIGTFHCTGAETACWTWGGCRAGY